MSPLFLIGSVLIIALIIFALFFLLGLSGRSANLKAQGILDDKND